MQSTCSQVPTTLAIGLGANLPSKVGQPITTLIEARPLLTIEITKWVSFSLKEKPYEGDPSEGIRWRWSPLFETQPIGGPSDQANYINAVLVVDGPTINCLLQTEEAALNLLARCIKLEKKFGRDRNKSDIRWGPRCLDIDLLAWGNLQVKNKLLHLPHPRLIERNFVITPLAEALSVNSVKPRQIEPQVGWE